MCFCLSNETNDDDDDDDDEKNVFLFCFEIEKNFEEIRHENPLLLLAFLLFLW